MRAGDFRCSESVSLFHLVSPFHRLVRDLTVALVWCCCGVFVVVCFVLSVPDLSFWSGCPTMTILAQLHDCHGCNDERSFDQKKKWNVFSGQAVLNWRNWKKDKWIWQIQCVASWGSHNSSCAKAWRDCLEHEWTWNVGWLKLASGVSLSAISFSPVFPAPSSGSCRGSWGSCCDLTFWVSTGEFANMFRGKKF